MSEHDDVLSAALRFQREGHGVAIATVVETWGSSPRPAGSQLVVRDDALFLGSVSGGCVEGRVVEEALEVIESDEPRLLDFGVSNEDAWDVGLACGGRVEIFVESLASNVELVRRLVEAIEQEEPRVAVTNLESGAMQILELGEGDDDEERHRVAEALRSDRCQRHGDLFFRPYNPPLRLIVVGAVHVTQALVVMARELGYDVTVIDPRPAFGNPERFPGVALSNDWPDEALAALSPDHRTAIVTFTHDPKIDDPALVAALATPAFYVGALGSRKTHASRRERLLAEGLSEADVARIHGPIGLPLGGRSPAEIALSTLAEITQVLRAERVA
jgi:xanthine dehydrogenase accessory factor